MLYCTNRAEIVLSAVEHSLVPHDKSVMYRRRTCISYMYNHVSCFGSYCKLVEHLAGIV